MQRVHVYTQTILFWFILFKTVYVDNFVLRQDLLFHWEELCYNYLLYVTQVLNSFTFSNVYPNLGCADGIVGAVC